MMELTPIEQEALLLSLKVGFFAVAWSLPFAIATGWLLARTNFPGKNIFNGIIFLPLVLPPVVVGYLLLVGFGNQGIFGRPLQEWFEFSFMFSWRGATLAAAVASFPLMVTSIRLSLEAVDRRLETAAATLGAPPGRIFLTVSLPLMAPGILAGMILAYARSLGEFGATITFVSLIPGETRTIPLAIYSLTQVPGGEALAARLVIIAIVVALSALMISEFFNRRMKKYIHG
jgi:molybdate transport system permease protein